MQFRRVRLYNFKGGYSENAPDLVCICVEFKALFRQSLPPFRLPRPALSACARRYIHCHVIACDRLGRRAVPAASTLRHMRKSPHNNHFMQLVQNSTLAGVSIFSDGVCVLEAIGQPPQRDGPKPVPKFTSSWRTAALLSIP